MKRLAAILLLASLSTACATLHSGGKRGPVPARTADTATPQDDGVAERERALGQR